MKTKHRPAKFILTVAILSLIVLPGCSDESAAPPVTATPEPAPVSPTEATASTPDDEIGTRPQHNDTEAASGGTSTPSLIAAAVAGDIDAMRELIKNGADLNERNMGGSTPLISAASFGQVESVKVLIEAGADVEAKNNEGSTALHSAAFLCREHVVKVLLDGGADPNAVNKGGATALDSVKGPFEEVKPIYDFIRSVLGPYGLEVDYEEIKAKRPKIAEMLREAS